MSEQPIILTFESGCPFNDACHPDIEADEILCEKCCQVLDSMNKLLANGKVLASEYRNHVDHKGKRYTIVMKVV